MEWRFFSRAVIVAQYAELRRRSPLRRHSGQAWGVGTSVSRLVKQVYRLLSVLGNGPEVVEFASLVSRASQIRALGN